MSSGKEAGDGRQASHGSRALPGREVRGGEVSWSYKFEFECECEREWEFERGGGVQEAGQCFCGKGAEAVWRQVRQDCTRIYPWQALVQDRHPQAHILLRVEKNRKNLLCP